MSADKDGRQLMPNVGLTSAVDSDRERILSLQSELVTAHEIAHNFGAEHDPESGKCAPSSFDGGKYLMWPYAVNGLEENNRFFSPCSKNWVASVLRAKAVFCFKEDVSFCGNGQVDKGEECDDHFFGVDAPHTCCTHDCMLKAGAECSDLNTECCRNCKIAPRGTKCADENSGACRNASFCNGYDFVCPEPVHLENGRQCLNRGRCLSYCEVLTGYGNMTLTVDHIRKPTPEAKLKPCVCDQNSTAACRYCCYLAYENGTRGACKPRNENLDDGYFCGTGRCQGGQCVYRVTNNALRLYKFLGDVNVNVLGEIMKDNVVAGILILTILVWVPGAIIVFISDKRDRAFFELKRHRYKKLNQAWRIGKGKGERRATSVRFLEDTEEITERSSKDIFLPPITLILDQDGRPAYRPSRENSLERTEVTSHSLPSSSASSVSFSYFEDVEESRKGP